MLPQNRITSKTSTTTFFFFSAPCSRRPCGPPRRPPCWYEQKLLSAKGPWLPAIGKTQHWVGFLPLQKKNPLQPPWLTTPSTTLPLLSTLPPSFMLVGVQQYTLVDIDKLFLIFQLSTSRISLSGDFPEDMLANDFPSSVHEEIPHDYQVWTIMIIWHKSFIYLYWFKIRHKSFIYLYWFKILF